VLWATLITQVVAAPPLQGEQTVHVVQVGETLLAIAQKYGVTIEAIVAANGLSDPNRIAVGQRLVIPGSISGVQTSTSSYVIQPGDTLALIARRYGTTADDLAQLNRLTNPNLIHVGQMLRIPEAGSTGTSMPGAGRVYVVQPGDTMARIAARYNLSVWAIAQANQIPNPGVIYAGQRLFIPTLTSSSNLAPPFLEVTILPVVAVQGQTMQVSVKTDGPVSLSGSYDDRPLFFVGGEGHYRTLMGIPALAAPGMYSLDLKAIKGEHEVSLHNMIQVVEGDFGVQYLTFSPQVAALLDPDLVTREAQRVWDVTTQATLPGLWQGPFWLPLEGNPSISSPFGVRRSYGGGPVSSYHSGVDFDVPDDTPVYCPAQGHVVLAEALQVRGNAVIVDHGRGVMTGYWHLSRMNVATGQSVEPGTLLGWVGSTGLSTGAHLHWEMRVMGIQVDALQWTREAMQ
jgi:murein DD-endopeptidase MepM/ murein hydrolase activator NlpD